MTEGPVMRALSRVATGLSLLAFVLLIIIFPEWSKL